MFKLVIRFDTLVCTCNTKNCMCSEIFTTTYFKTINGALCNSIFKRFILLNTELHSRLIHNQTSLTPFHFCPDRPNLIHPPTVV